MSRRRAFGGCRITRVPGGASGDQYADFGQILRTDNVEGVAAGSAMLTWVALTQGLTLRISLEFPANRSKPKNAYIESFEAGRFRRGVHAVNRTLVYDHWTRTFCLLRP